MILFCLQDGWRKVYKQAYEEYWWSWIPFIAFLVTTAFVFANLIIAVICDAVHVLSDDKAAGLIGIGEDEIERRKAPSPKSRGSVDVDCALVNKLTELAGEIDEIVSVQNQLVAAISAVSSTR